MPNFHTLCWDIRCTDAVRFCPGPVGVTDVNQLKLIELCRFTKVAVRKSHIHL